LQVRNFPSREEWLQARKNYIGGSDAAAILGLNPWKTNVDLWEEKTGRKEAADISDNEAVKFGSQSEPYLRELFKLDNPDLDVRYMENNMFLNDTYPWAHASLDGWLKDKEGRAGILEIKTTTIQNYASVKKWENKIPDNYYCQILHYFLVTGFDFAILKARLKFDFENPYCQIRHYRIERQECENDIILLMDAERRFAENIKNDIRPSLLLPEI
jgi:putative phage-type endonuclease